MKADQKTFLTISLLILTHYSIINCSAQADVRDRSLKCSNWQLAVGKWPKRAWGTVGYWLGHPRVPGRVLWGSRWALWGTPGGGRGYPTAPQKRSQRNQGKIAAESPSSQRNPAPARENRACRGPRSQRNREGQDLNHHGLLVFPEHLSHGVGYFAYCAVVFYGGYYARHQVLA
jgi:hypothetical protein